MTGAAGGIGRAMVRGPLAAGVRVAGVDRDREPLEALAASAGEQGKGDDFLTVQTDLTGDFAVDEITGSAASTSSSTTPGSALAPSGRIAGNAPSSSGKSRPINGAGLSRCTRRHPWRSRMRSRPR